MAALTVSAALVKAPVATSLRPANKAQRAAFVSNATVQKTKAMMVWTPLNNKVSYLLPRPFRAGIADQPSSPVQPAKEPALCLSFPDHHSQTHCSPQ